MYEKLAAFAQTGGLILFVVAFILVLIYALAPSNKDKFKRAASAPLNETPDADEAQSLVRKNTSCEG